MPADEEDDDVALDVVVMDAAMPGLGGIAATRRILAVAPDTRILMLSMHSEETLVRQALDAGARGYVLKGALGTAVVALGQPALTVINLALTTALTLTSVLWAPLAALLGWAFNLVIYDHNAQDGRRLLPLVQLVVGDLALGGVVRMAAALVGAGVFHPVVGALAVLWGNLRAGLRAGYDLLVRSLIIRRLGRVPASTSFLARRVEGPGLSSAYFFQVAPEVVLLTLQANAELEELELYRTKATAELEGPQNELQTFLNSVLGLFGSQGGPTERVATTLHATTAAHLERLRRATEPREQMLRRFTSLPSADHIRQTRRDLATTLALATDRVRGFYPARILGRLTQQEQEAYWANRGLHAADWEGLARQLLAASFSPGLLEPLEETDRSLRLTIEHIDVGTYLSSLERGAPLGGELDRVREPALAETPTVPLPTLAGPAELLSASGRLSHRLQVPPKPPEPELAPPQTN